MWNNISSLAQIAKDAAALLEEQINDSIGMGAAAGHNVDASGDAGVDGDGPVRGSDGWEKCGDISSEDGSDDEKVKKNMPQEMSFVDLKSAAEAIPKNDAGGLESNAALLDALARIESLEEQVSSLKVELASAKEAAREESENYHATNLLLEQQVKELQEENRSLKESGDSEN
mmetsp:Transcript_8404/g.15293  ORF Transcript_8404/g.15293 Transcript_8404/m.15293 type:complete len:173 (+) Transcript_8404:29-547(+)|eukprot:CAMPEP_0201883024 /NCGR_PEP_ID=MMETSP0902-20130614/15104_1 /ASSEMBLY_ACC=CAM_ASM_000551 /TAXON_ID=420261 /ORGANISM="Thalassiosira antarctica, Strain CCMP982" /LENGTH=172 /DNA_ID=CAMNT_0048411727 /DNA_START=13 /DNA_END=531 /DNA_ORIENTATION=-